MKIIIIGCGKVGLALAQQLVQEKHNITLVDLDADRVNDAVNSLDVQGVVGNGTSRQTLEEAAVNIADLVIAVTDHDERNMLACLIARKSGHCQTIARVRDPGYYQDITFIKEELGLAMVINPERAAAEDIYRLLQIPSALDVDVFAKGRVNMIRFPVESGSPLDGRTMMEVNPMLGGKMLVCIRERDGKIEIPSGQTDLKVGDKISVVMPMADIGAVLQKLKLQHRQIKSVTIAGGSATSVYLTGMLEKSGVQVKIIEESLERCNELAEMLPKATIIHGDTTDKQLLQEEGLASAEGFVCLTGMDEENIMLALYAQKISKAKVVTKIGHIEFEEVISELPLGSIVQPRNIIAETIVQYVSAMENASGNNVETLYKIEDGRVEAMEFTVHSGSKNLIGIPFAKLGLKKNLLVCCIKRGDRIFIPTGQDTFESGDVVVIVTTQKGIRNLEDIVR